MARLTKEQYKQTYSLLYAKISKATAEVKNGNETIKSVYKGTLSNLFGEVELCSNTITAFLWAVSHKTNALPTTLFKISKLSKGVEISRIHSGFYNNNGEHIIGTALVPFIMEAMREYKPIHKRSSRNTTSEKAASTNMQNVNYESYSEDELNNIIAACESEIRKREEIRAKQIRIQNVLDQIGMTREELLNLLSVC